MATGNGRLVAVLSSRKEAEFEKSAIRDLETQLEATQQELAKVKVKATNAEARLNRFMKPAHMLKREEFLFQAQAPLAHRPA